MEKKHQRSNKNNTTNLNAGDMYGSREILNICTGRCGHPGYTARCACGYVSFLPKGDVQRGRGKSCSTCARRMRQVHLSDWHVMRIIKAIEADLNDRRGFHLSGLPAPIRRSIRNEWKALIRDANKLTR